MCAGRTAALILVVEALIRSGNCGSSPFSRKWCWDRSGLEPSQNKSALFQPKRRCTPVHQVRTRPLRLCVKDPSQQVPAKWEEARLCLCLLASLCEGADEVGQMYGKANVGTKWESEQEKVSIKMHWVFGETVKISSIFFTPPLPPASSFLCTLSVWLDFHLLKPDGFFLFYFIQMLAKCLAQIWALCKQQVMTINQETCLLIVPFWNSWMLDNSF